LIPKPGGGYTYDFSVIDKMLDLAAKTMGSPLPLQVNCWGDDRFKDKKKNVSTAWATSAKNVAVMDPKTGKLTALDNPPPGSEENYAFWKPILDELRKRIEKRGWVAVTALGHQSYCWEPSPGQVTVAHRIWPDGVYSFSAHSGVLNGRFKGNGGVVMPVPYSECVWTQGQLEPRGCRRLLADGRDRSIWDSSSRNAHQDNSSLLTLLLKPEEMILRGHDGLGYMCSDFLPIENPNRKDQYFLLDTSVGNVIGNSTRSFLAAGPEGPIATGRYEMFKEGVQVSQTILFLERLLQDKKIEGDLAKRINAYLDRRSESFIRGWHVNRRQSDRELFTLAAEAVASGNRRGKPGGS